VKVVAKTGTGYEVCDTRKERARDCEVLHAQRCGLSECGACVRNDLCHTLGDLPLVQKDWVAGVRDRLQP
jgi:hypothetical protein